MSPGPEVARSFARAGAFVPASQTDSSRFRGQGVRCLDRALVNHHTTVESLFTARLML